MDEETGVRSVDLFLAAGITGNAIVDDEWKGNDTVWMRAYKDNLPFGNYLILKTIALDHTLKNVEVRGCIHSVMTVPSGILRPCSSTGWLNQEKDDELFCAVYEADEDKAELFYYSFFDSWVARDLGRSRKEFAATGRPDPLKRMLACDEKHATQSVAAQSRAKLSRIDQEIAKAGDTSMVNEEGTELM